MVFFFFFFFFFLGLQLQPQNLLHVVGKTLWITLVSSLAFGILGTFIVLLYGYTINEGLVVGACMMFSSTIISLKLLSHRSSSSKHLNEVMIGVLLLQDLIAIMVLLGIDATSHGKIFVSELALIFLSLPSILLFVFLVERFVLSKIFDKFSEVREYVLLVSIAWCFGVAELARTIGLSYEIGAFVAGIAIAASPISRYITEQLKPIRDFFLVLFFFVIGASLNLRYFGDVIIPAITLTILFIIAKPAIFYFLLRRIHECKNLALEAGIRLGQMSEFSLLVIFLAYRNGLISISIIYLVQAITMFMFITSSYLVVSRYPAKMHTLNKNDSRQIDYE